jgi:hypothetical protein
MDNAVLSPLLMLAVRRVFRPLVRLMLANGVTYPLLTEMMKGIFVETAARDFRLSDRELTDSRISLLTGIHRKDVRRLRDETGTVAPKPAGVSLAAQVISVWTGSPDFIDAEGHPLLLHRLASRGGAKSFEELAARVSTDVRSRPMLDELLRLGVVQLDEEDRVALAAEAFVPRQGLEEKLFYFGHNLHDHAAAAVHNVIGEGEPWLERSVHYGALAPESVAELRSLAEKSGMQAIQAVNRKALALEEGDTTAPQSQQRMTFGIYFYAAPAEETAPVSAPPADEVAP